MNGILIVGAGIAGLSLARQLKKFGIAYTLIEKKSQFDVTGSGIALPANAVHALRRMDLSVFVDDLHQVNQIIYARANGRVISQASLLTSPLNKDKFVALNRHTLLTALCDGVREDIHFNTTITAMMSHDAGVEVTFSNPTLNGQYQAVIGADGIYSNVRQLAFASDELVDLHVTNWRWVCDYSTEKLQPTYMFGTHNVFLAYPIGPHQVYCYAHHKDAMQSYQDAIQAHDNIMQVFANYKGVARMLLNDLPPSAQIYTGRLRSVPKPLFSKQRVALIGDASSACSPMLQQGAASAFEDVLVLSMLLSHFSIEQAFALYQVLREPRVNWIVKTSDDAIRAFVRINSWFGAMKRNLLFKHKGPLNVLSWKTLLASCPLDEVERVIESVKKEALK